MMNGSCNSPLMTTSNPFRKQQGTELREDSCLKFKMKESVMTGKMEECETSGCDSPNLRKSMQQGPYKESRFGQERRQLDKKDMNTEQ